MDCCKGMDSRRYFSGGRWADLRAITLRMAPGARSAGRFEIFASIAARVRASKG